MMLKMKHFKFCWLLVFSFILTSCTSLDDVNKRLDTLEEDVSDIKTALQALQIAYDEGKVVSSVTPLSSAQGGWLITFSDGATIKLENGKDGVDGKDGNNGANGITPYLLVDQDGYWCVSYDNGSTFSRMMDNNGIIIKAQGDNGKKGDQGEKGDKGDDGVSIRVVVNNEGYYVFELYKASAPNLIIDSVVTPYNTNPEHLITNIAEDEVTHVISITMQNGKTYTFNKKYDIPSSIGVLTNKVMLSEGNTATVEFRVNPSNAVFNYDVSSTKCEIEIDKVSEMRRTIASYVTTPSCYKLTKVEQVYDETGNIKKGQYRAHITDLNISKTYHDRVSFVLTIDNGMGEKVQVSSSAFEVLYSGSLITAFSFKKSNNPSILEDVEATINGNSIIVDTPFIFDLTSLIPSFTSNGDKVYVGNIEQKSNVSSNDFTSPITYKVLSATGETNSYNVIVRTSALPVVYINTPSSAAITSKTEWTKNSSISIINTNGEVDYTDTKLQIRGRGNSTWGYPKKTYALKLDKKTSILGMPKHKRWVLLANWMDRTLLRNDVTFQIARKTGLGWTPRGKFVEVVLNGRHIGNYYLCEQIKIDENRVNINSMETTDISGDAVTGGYLMELDVYFDEVNKFKSATKQLPYMFKEPDEEVLQPEQLNYFEGYINAMESYLYNDNWLINREYAGYLDLESFADWWFVYELAKNGEPNHPKSCYMHKDRLDVLKAGPVWDFDWGTFTPGTSYSVKNAIYYGRLFQDPVFISIVKSRWSILKSGFETIPEYIRSIASTTKNSNNLNISLWPISSRVNGDETMSFEDAINRMVAAYEAKLQWLDIQISGM